MHTGSAERSLCCQTVAQTLIFVSSLPNEPLLVHGFSPLPAHNICFFKCKAGKLNRELQSAVKCFLATAYRMRACSSFCQSAQSLQGIFLLLGSREVFWCANFLLSSHSFKDTLWTFGSQLWLVKREMLQKVVQVIGECHLGLCSCTKGCVRVCVLSYFR